MVPQGRIELPTSSLPMMRSTTELLRPLQFIRRGLAYAPGDEKRLTEGFGQMAGKEGKLRTDIRARRMANALRDNLKKRKAAARKRAEDSMNGQVRPETGKLTPKK